MQQKAAVRLTWFPDSHVPNYLDNHAARDNDVRTLNRTDSQLSARRRYSKQSCTKQKKKVRFIYFYVLHISYNHALYTMNQSGIMHVFQKDIDEWKNKLRNK